MTSFRTILITVTVAATCSLAAAMPAAAQGGGTCLTDQQIQAEIASGEIQSWPKIKKLAGISAYEEVSDVRVCLRGDVPYYTVNVVSPNGEAKKIAINAVDGSA